MRSAVRALVLVALLLFLAWDINLHRTSASPKIGRFVPVTPNSAVDSVTGRLCWTYDPIGTGSDLIPLCADLYYGKKKH